MLSDNNIRAVFKAMPIPTLILRPDAPHFNIIEVNEAYLQATRSRAKDLIGKKLFEAFPESPDKINAAGISKLIASLKQVLDTGLPHIMEMQRYDIPIRDTDAFEERYWEPQNIPVHNSRGEVDCIIHIVKDVTEQVKSRQQYEQNQGLLEALANQSNSPMYVRDKEGRYFFTNKKFEQVFGSGKLQPAGQRNSGPSAPPKQEDDLQIIKSRSPVITEETINTPDGTRYYLTNKFPLTLLPGQEQAIGGIATDITHRKQVEAEKEQIFSRLQKRNREQTCLYNISSLREQDMTIEELLEKAVRYLPNGWQYPQIAEAKITFGDRTYQTGEYTDTPWTLTAQSEQTDGSSLSVEVVYTEEKQPEDEGPFLKEERLLIDSVINHLALKINHRLSQLKLEEEQQLLDKAYQLARIGTWEFDMRTHELQWSAVTKEVHGFGPDYQPDVESTIALFKEGIHRDTFARAVHNAIEHEQPFDVELKIISGQGDERWIRATGEPEYKDGVCTRFYGISQNVSDRKHAEINYKNLFELSPLPKFVYDAETLRFLNVNQQAIEHYGYSKEEFLSMTIKDIRPEEDIPLLEQALEQSLQAVKARYNFEFRHQKKDGEIIHVEIQSAKTNYNGRAARMVVAHDITEQQKAEQALKLSEQRFKALVQDGSDLIAILDPEANYTYVSPTSESILGISAEDLIGTNAMDYIHEEDQPRITEVLANLSDQKRVHIPAFRFRDAEGNWRWIETIATNMLDDPAVGGIVANSRDMTEHMEREAQLQNSLDRYDAVIKATKDAIYDWDVTENKLLWGDSFSTVFGYTNDNEPITVEGWVAKIHPDDQKRVNRTLTQTLDKPDSDVWKCEYRFARADGTYAMVAERGFIIRNEEGEPIRMIGALQDISRRKEEENRLKLLESVITNTTDAVIIKEAVPEEGPGRKIVYVNDAFTRMTGYKREEVIGQTTEMFNGPRTDVSERCRIEEAMERWEPCMAELINYKKNGDEFWVSISLVPVANQDGNYTHWIAIERDITQRKQQEAEMRASLIEKEVLLAEVHHRVKNNLAVVSGMMQLQAFEESNKPFAHKLMNSVTRIKTMAAIHEQLYQSNSFSQLNFSENLEKLVLNIISTMQTQTRVKTRFECEPVQLNVNQAIPCALIANEVVTNVLKHAFNSQKKGRIEVSLTQTDDQLILVIEDDGIGLPEDFDPENNSTLGMHLICVLSRQLEADYQFDSTGTGSRFTLRFDVTDSKGIGNAYLQ